MTRAFIAICTCDRHGMLRDLLSTLAKQSHSAVPIIIVDNGSVAAREVVEAFGQQLDIHYERLAQTGLSPVRNRAVEIAMDRGATHIASIDDDEYPAEGWLDALLAAAEEADLVYGDVYPVYDGPPPSWVEHMEPFVKHGAPGTANLLLALSCLPENRAEWFRPEFSGSGGEDVEILQRLEDQGARAVRAKDAVVYEQIPPSRLTLRYVARLGLRDGVIHAKLMVLKHGATASLLPGIRLAAGKLGYALNHLFWAAAGERWRFYRGTSDIGMAVGLACELVGIELRFYGRRRARAEESATFDQAAASPNTSSDNIR